MLISKASDVPLDGFVFRANLAKPVPSISTLHNSAELS